MTNFPSPPPGATAFKAGMWVVVIILVITMVRIWLIIFNFGPPIEVTVR